MKNWAGNLTFSAKEYVEIDSTSKLQSIVRNASGIKVLATGHSFNEIADTAQTQISIKNLSNEIEIDTTNKFALVPAGMQYADVCRYLEKRGWALFNTASLGEITVAGAVLTGTHGSGSSNPVLSDCVDGIEMVLASGDLFSISREDSEEFSGFVVSLGALGVFTKLRLKIVESFSIKQFVYENIGIQSIAENFDAVFDKAYSVSYFSNWKKNTTGQIWMKFLDDNNLPQLPTVWLDGNIANAKQHPVKVNDPSPCTDQIGISGTWLYRLPHFKLDSSPASGDEVQTEYLVDRSHVSEYIAELSNIGDEIAERVYATEIRTIKSDELWFFHQGEALEIVFIKEGVLNTIILGNNLENGEVVQATIPANTWFASRVKNLKGYSLVSCTVAPGFDFADFELAKREDLINEFPNLKETIEKFTKE